MPFEVFKRRNVPNRGVAVTVNQRGQLALSEAAHQALGGARHVTLLFNRESRTAGIRPSRDGEDGFVVTNSRLINAAAFFEAFGIPRDRTIRRHAVVRDGVLCVDVDDEGLVVSSNRAKAPRETAPPQERRPT